MIKNKKSLIANGKKQKEKKARKDLLFILEKVLKSTDPYFLVKKNIKLKGNQIEIAKTLKLKLDGYKNIYVVGAGKATYKMALAVESILEDKIAKGLINIQALSEKNQLKNIIPTIARHPIPSASGVRGANKIKNLVSKAGKDDLVIGLISGGGSALLPLPIDGVSLTEKTKLTSELLKCSATIGEINTVRKHLSQIKGGRLAHWVSPATMVSLYISDVVGDDLQTIASGPTIDNCATCQEAVDILKRHKIWSKCPPKIKSRLRKKDSDNEVEKVASGKIYNYIIGNHQTAVTTAAKTARKLGYHVVPLTSSIHGEAREVAKALVSFGLQVHRYGKPAKKSVIFIAGGETTVQVRGKGKGGRNQELVLSGMRYLEPGMTLLSFGTDGIDGMNPKPVAGAIADYFTLEKAIRKKIKIKTHLANNDSYHFFDKLNEHIKTDYTGTNVGDLMMLLVI